MKYGWRGVTKRRQAEGKVDFCHLLQIPKSVIALRGGWVVVWGTFFPGTKWPFGGFLLPETDPLGPAGARVLIMLARVIGMYVLGPWVRPGPSSLCNTN